MGERRYSGGHGFDSHTVTISDLFSEGSKALLSGVQELVTSSLKGLVAGSSPVRISIR